MIWRTYDEDRVLRAIEQVKDDLKGLPPSVWLSDRKNYAFTNAVGDVALFEYRSPGIYTGHYFFHSRGRYAIDTARDILSYVFSDKTDIQLIIGMTPIDKKGALWLTNHLGFKSYGDEEIDGKVHRIFTMTRKDFR